MTRALSYESRFRLSAELGISGPRHDFAPGRERRRAADRHRLGGQRRRCCRSSGTSHRCRRTAGAARTSDVDVWFYDTNGEPIEICTDDPAQVVCQIPGFDANIGGDAVETPIMVNFSDADIEVQIGIELFEGPAPNYVKYVWFDLDAGVFTVDEYDTASGTVYGHANAAAPRPSARPPGTRPRNGAARCARSACPACLNSFSSAGGTPVFFGANGHRLRTPGGAHQAGRDRAGRRQHFFLLLRPEFRGAGNFRARRHSRTSSAPRLPPRTWRRWRPSCWISGRATWLPVSASSGPRKLTPDLIYWALRLTADDMKLRNFGGDIGPQRVDNANGFDFDTGFGFVDAQRALRATRGF